MLRILHENSLPYGIYKCESYKNDNTEQSLKENVTKLRK